MNFDMGYFRSVNCLSSDLVQQILTMLNSPSLIWPTFPNNIDFFFPSWLSPCYVNQGINQFVCTRYAGILSAYGMALADVVHEAQEPCARTYNQGNAALSFNPIRVLSVHSVTPVGASLSSNFCVTTRWGQQKRFFHQISRALDWGHWGKGSVPKG